MCKKILDKLRVCTLWASFTSHFLNFLLIPQNISHISSHWVRKVSNYISLFYWELFFAWKVLFFWGLLDILNSDPVKLPTKVIQIQYESLLKIKQHNILFSSIMLCLLRRGIDETQVYPYSLEDCTFYRQFFSIGLQRWACGVWPSPRQRAFWVSI